MIDKQIIIDRVDVGGCDFLNKTRHCKAHISIMGTDTNKCKCFSNCYYKQLKRKEQEVQQAMDNYVQLDLQRVKEYNELVDLYKAKEQECEELKAKIKYMEEYIKTVENARNEFEKESNFLKEKNKRLKQTLTEIKEIAEGMHDLWINKTPYTDINNLVEHLLECELNRIRYKLDEIIECEVEDAR